MHRWLVAVLLATPCGGMTHRRGEMSEHSHSPSPAQEDALRWKHDGVRVIKGDKLDPNTAQTPGMFRQAAINHARVGSQKIWAGTVSIQPNAKTGVHHSWGVGERNLR